MQAQTPTYEPPNLKTVLFGGHSSVSIKPGTNLDRVSRNGWTASITNYSYFQRWGLTAEFGGNSDDGTRHRTFLFGGTYRALQRKRFALTGRILAGGTTWDPKAPTSASYRSQTAFTFGFGQTIDVKFSERFALRVQPDLRFVRFQNPTADPPASPSCDRSRSAWSINLDAASGHGPSTCCSSETGRNPTGLRSTAGIPSRRTSQSNEKSAADTNSRSAFCTVQSRADSVPVEFPTCSC